MPNPYGSGAGSNPQPGISLGLTVPVVVLPHTPVAAGPARAVGCPASGGREIVPPLAGILHRLPVKARVICAAHAGQVLHPDASTVRAGVVDHEARRDRAVSILPSESVCEQKNSVATNVAVAVVPNAAFPDDAREVTCHTESV